VVAPKNVGCLLALNVKVIAPKKCRMFASLKCKSGCSKKNVGCSLALNIKVVASKKCRMFASLKYKSYCPLYLFFGFWSNLIIACYS